METASRPMEPQAESQSADAPWVLVIDDEPSLLRYFEYNLRSMGCKVALGRSLADLDRLLEERAFAALLLDLMLPDGEALDHLPQILDRRPALSVILITAYGSIPKAVEAIRKGAINFIQKPVSVEQLEGLVRQAVEIWRLKGEVRTLRRKLEPADEFQGMVGRSEPMQAIYNMIETVAASSTPVMITGESGAGKELVARAIHVLSPRSSQPYIAINCAAIPRELLESEILGHEKGAFTGAIEQHKGCFERADRGTLFLDEICEMDVGLQAKLLRLIQDQRFYRIGGSTQIRVAVRIVTATNKDPQKMIEAGKFREDLYYRLNVLPIHLPPLRERREDIALIAHHLLRQLSASNRKPFRGFTREAMRDLEKYPWPGNVRELQNVLEQAVVLHEGDRITSEMLPRSLREDLERPDLTRAERTPRSEAGADAVRPFWQIERDEIQHALDLCRGNVQEAARRLELSPATLYRKIERYGLVR